jgi:lipoprotein-anchoring transpeptidase ErfK/SrfK
MAHMARLRIATFLSAPIMLAACSATPAHVTPARSVNHVDSARSGSAGTNPSQGSKVNMADGPDTVLTLSVAGAPAASLKAAPISAEIGTVHTDGQITSVNLISAGGASLDGWMRSDGSSWVPAAPLKYDESYIARGTAQDGAGRAISQTLTFHTMVTAPKTAAISTRTNLTGGATYGVGMPIVVDFSESIPQADRAAVEKRLFVASSPIQLGAWRWFTGKEVMYRPRSYWKPGTHVSVRLGLAGVSVGGRTFARDVVENFSIGRDLEITVTNNSHMLTVASAGAVLHRYPISMGKPSTPSWSGNFVIMERDYYVVFDTLDKPGGYRIPVNYAERITWSGTFIHSAPWSVYAQGSRNVSHGCVNVAPTSAKWIYENSKIGDPVNISGTPVHARDGNGWTVWDVTWSDYLGGSALPAPTLDVPDNVTPSV